jgi:peptidoglycan/xylan/chitin deacetylase (PgdA/CDA1 family)
MLQKKVLFNICFLLSIFFTNCDMKKETESEKNTTGTNIAQEVIRDSTKKYIYLTFDDGPINGSRQIDSIITIENIKASAFLVGKNAEMSKKYKINYGNYLANPLIGTYNHTYSHGNDHYVTFYANTDSVVEDIKRNDSYFKFKYKNIRLAGRNIWNTGKHKKTDGNSGSIASDVLVQNGYKMYGWDIEWHHKKNGRPVQSVEKIIHGIEWIFANKKEVTKNNIVLLMHDEMFQKPEEIKKLQDLIQKLKQHPDYVFEEMKFYPD